MSKKKNAENDKLNEDEIIDEAVRNVTAEESECPEAEEKEQLVESLKNELELLKSENSDLKDKFLRKQADFENYRKRMVREKQDAIRFSNTNLLGDLIEIIDDFERAIQSSEGSNDFQSFHDGIVMIEKQFTSMLEKKYGLKKIEAEGEEFDPSKHEALMMENSDEHEEPVVLQVLQTGYQLHERVVRPSKVKVANPVSSSEKAESGKENTIETEDKE